MLSPLDRDQGDYVRAMQDWLACDLLDMHERHLVEQLLRAALASIQDFDAMRRVALSGMFYPVLISAIVKARSQGINHEWQS